MVAVIEQNSGPQYLYSNDGRIYGSSTRRCKQDCEEDNVSSPIDICLYFSWNFLEDCGDKMVWNRYERRQSTWRNNEVFRLNVGGKSFCFRPDTVLDHREPNSLLARLVRLEHRQRLLLTDGFQSGEYYLERNARVAEHVLDYFLTGKLHKPPEICPQRFSEELLFWRLTRVELAPCCSVLTDTQQKLKRTLDTERQLDQVNCCRGLRKVIWHLLESPSSSLFSKLFTLLSVIFIVASVVGLVLGSMPEFQADSRFADSYHALLGARKGYSSNNNVNENITTTTVSTTVKLKKMKLPLAKENLNVNKSRSDHFMEKLKESPPQVFIYRPTDNPQRWLVVLENCCIAWFTMDFLLRLLVAPRRWLFLRQPLNLIDLFTVLPFYCELALSQMGVHNTEGLKDFAGAMLVMRVLRVLRMARVFKLARYSTGLQVFGATLRTSLRELCMLSMFLLCGTIFFSTLMYYAEKDEPGSDFKSIPAACWWCIITVTTVGYGDCQILSWVGKLIAGLSSVFGIIILAFPISMVVENFAVAQQKLKLENQLKEENIYPLIKISSENIPFMWHYQSYNKPITWENYYSQRHATITSGIAAATTIVIFFVILLLTFGCRFFSNRRRRRGSTRTADGNESVGASQHSLDDQRMFVICNCSIPPPLPSYEDALKMVPRPLDVERGEKEALPPPPKYSLTSGENIFTITPMSTSTTNIAHLTTGEQQQEENQSHQSLPSTAIP